MFSYVRESSARPHVRRVLALVWLGAAFCGPTLAAQATDLAGTLDSIRKAFLADDSTVMQRQFSAGRPIYVSIPRFEKGRFLGPGPLQALLDRVVADTETIAFEFSSTGEPALSSRYDGQLAARSLRNPIELPRHSDQRHMYIKARWTYVETASSVRRTLNLYLAIQRQSDGGDWRIVELKAFD